MADQLKRAFLSWYDNVRARPSESIGPGLERLKAIAEASDVAVAYAQKSPVANVTWMQRAILQAAQATSPLMPMEITYACKIVGCVPTVLLVQAGQAIVEPPLAAIDVFMQLDRTETFTARQDKLLAAGQDSLVCNLAAFADTVRSFELDLNNDNNVLSVTFKWAVDLATVAAFGWGDVQISLNWFVDPKLRDGERAFAKGP
jgi:hypothetical protein